MKKRSDADDRQTMRQEAEARFERRPPASATRPPSAELQHELQVHQIELEMQNEELQRTKVALEEARDRYRDLYDFAPVGYLTLGEGELIQEVNLAGAALLGLDRVALRGRRLAGFVAPPDQVRWRRLLDEIRGSDEPRGCELRLQRGDGSVVEASFSGTRQHRVDGLAKLRLVLADVSEQRRLEARYQHAQRLESVGRLAGGVAHDFNNLLTVVLAGVEELRQNLAEEIPIDVELVEDIGTAGARARNLTRQLLAFARKQVLAPVLLDLNRVILGSEPLLRRMLREDVALTLALEPGPAIALCDEGQVEQLLMNLVANARDAIPAGGTVTIETRHSADALAEIPEEERELGRWVHLLVRDSGCGMAPEVTARLFEPFFTTKPQGQGTGLGLATVHGIVSQAGGHLHVRSEPGKGSTFVLCFPRQAEQVEAAVAPRPADRPTPARGSETILVVEDEAQVRKVAVRALRAAGYLVLEASGGAEVEALGEDQVAGLQLLLTDVIMPGKSGVAVAAELLRRRPGLPVLFMSGYAQDAFAGKDGGQAGASFLPKPFTQAALLERVRAVLDAAPGAATP